MSITVHDQELWLQIMGPDLQPTGSAPASDQEQQVKSGGSRVSRSINTATSQTSSRLLQPSSSQLVRAKEWLTKKATRNMSDTGCNSYSCKEFVEIISICDELRVKEDKLLEELEDFLSLQSTYDQCKREMLYQKWSERVFTPLQMKLAGWMDNSYEEFDKGKRKLFNNYLDLRAHKSVFLDTITTSEYNPLALHQSTDKMRKSTLQDPLLSQLEDCAKERTVISECDEGAVRVSLNSAPLGRENSDPLLWLAMKLTEINSEARQRSCRRMKGVRNHSHLDKDAETKVEVTTQQKLAGLPHKTPIHYKRTPISLHWQ